MRREAWPSTGPMSSAVVRARASARRSGRSSSPRTTRASAFGLSTWAATSAYCRIVRSMRRLKRKRRGPR